ncbi:MAG: hypothetical protein AAFX54_03135 [Pseudomonadota bacterium]
MAHSRLSRKTATRFALVAATLAVTAAPAHACYTVKLTNDTDRDVHAVWTAAGCAGLIDGVPFSCEGKSVKTGETKSHNFDWGKTAPGISIFTRKDELGIAYVIATYGYRGGGHGFAPGVWARSPSGCGHTYSVNFTEDDISAGL